MLLVLLKEPIKWTLNLKGLNFVLKSLHIFSYYQALA